MDRVKRDQFLATVREDRERFDRIVQAVPAHLLTVPILPGGWSVKDVLAHVAWGEREAIGIVRARALVGSDLCNVSEDERNEAVVRESRSSGLDDVVAEYRAAFPEYLSALEELSEADLNEPERFERLAERIPGWPPWRVLYDPTHYDEHGRAIAAALANADSGARGG